MRSGFLNASSCDSPASSLDKGSRNKRKFRTDQQQQSPASPLPTPVCGEGSKNVVNVGETCSSGAMDPRSLDGADAGAVSPDSIACCNSGQHTIPLDHLNHPSNYPCVGNVPLPHYSLHATDFPADFQHFSYPKDGQEYGESPQDSDWDRFSEVQLEEILMSMLEVVYKDAVKKLTSCDFSQEEALNAVLRNGRWNGRDALTSIVEGSLAWLQNSEARGSTAELVFSDLKEIGSYVLAEMICMLRKVRPYLSKGDAMWCLLMCDLNVLNACTMEEDAMPPSLLKDGNAPTVVPSQSKGSCDPPSSNVPPPGATTAVPLPQQTPRLPQAIAQPSNFLVTSHKDSRSAFSTPNFSSSPDGKVAVACLKGTSSKPSISMSAHTPNTSANSEAVSSTQEQELQSVGVLNSYQLSSPQIPTWEEHATKLGLSTASLVGSASTEISGDSQINSCKDEVSVNYTNHGVSVSQILGCIDSNDEEKKTVMLWQLVDRVKYLEAQLQEWTDWAQQKVMQAARRLTKDTAELKALRQERDEFFFFLGQQQAAENINLKNLAEVENSLHKALSQVDRANSTAWRLEAENEEVRAEIEAAKLTAAESVSVCQEATKREKKSTKKAQGWEKQKLKLQDDLVEGKRNLSSLLEQLSQARERQQQAEVRWKQEKKAKEEALLHAETEKQAKEQVERSAKRREDTLQRKSETESQRYREEVQKLESEIARVKLSSGLQPSRMSWGNGFGMASSNLDTCSAEMLKRINARLLSEIEDLQQSQRGVHRDRECVMCMSEEMSVVFLPCAHQAVCVKCNDLHQRQGLRDCPSCRTPVQQRIRVYGARS